MTMLCLLVMTGLLVPLHLPSPERANAAPTQQPATEARAEAERLARTGSYAEALRRFEAIAAANPDDLDARVWIGRLQQWMGHPNRAVDVFRSVLSAKPDRLDARIGLGSALTALDRPGEAVDELDRAEQIAPDDPEVLAAQGAAHLAAAHVRLALAYYGRAALLRPADPSIREAYEEARRQQGHFVAGTGYFESFSGSISDGWSGSLELNGRLGDSLRLFVRGQGQRKFDETEARGGGGFAWRPTRHWTLRARALFGPDTTVLPRIDTGGELVFTDRHLSAVGGVQYVDFEPGLPAGLTVRAWIVSPGLTVRVNDDFEILARYYRSATEYGSSGARISNHSGLLGARLRLVPRVWIGAAWETGAENFDTLSIDRLGDFNADAVRGDLQIDFRSLTSIAATYEYQWREHDRQFLRASFGLVQRF